MGAYTQSIREILQYNQRQNETLTDVEDVYNISSRCIFDKMPNNVIEERYKKQFITGFTLHFMNEELGLETTSLWKVALNEKIYNSGSYINKIFNNLDKEVFADYKVKAVDNDGTMSDNKTGSGTITNVKTGETTTATSDEISFGSNVRTGGDTTLTATGTVENAKSGSDVLTRTGTDVNSKSGNDVRESSGDTTSEGTHGERTDNSGNTSNDHNSVQINYDTPQGSLSNMRTPGGDAKGSGVNYANNNTYNYMSAAAELDESNVQTDNTHQNVDGEDRTYTESSDRTETTYGSSDTRTLNLDDTTQYGGKNTETRNTQDITRKDETVTKGGKDERSVNTTVGENTNDTQTRNTTDVTTGAHTDHTDVIDYSLNWEMLYKSMPLLNKVWELFDDLFMIIF